MIKTQCTGEAMIFKKEFDGRVKYSCTLSKQNKDKEWEQAFITIQFRQGVQLAHKQKINLTNAWLTFYTDKEGKPVFYIFCNEFENGLPEGFAQLDEDEEIPFLRK